MRTLGDKVNQIPEREREPTIELGTTPLHPNIEMFYKRWGRDYQPIYGEDMPETIYEEYGK